MRSLLTATALAIVVAAGMWMVGAHLAAHAVATADAGDRAVAQRSGSAFVKTTVRVPLAALALGGAYLLLAGVVSAHTVARVGARHATTRRYALFHVYRL
jgi:hypothetical protein